MQHRFEHPFRADSGRSTVGFAAMEDAPDFDGVNNVDKEQSVIADAQPEFVAPLKGFHVALAQYSETMQCEQNAHGSGFI